MPIIETKPSPLRKKILMADQPVLSEGTVIKDVTDPHTKITKWLDVKFFMSDGEKWGRINGYPTMSNGGYPYFVHPTSTDHTDTTHATLYSEQHKKGRSYECKHIIPKNSNSSIIYTKIKDFTYIKKYKGLDKVTKTHDSALLFQVSPTQYLFIHDEFSTYEFSLMDKDEEIVQLYTRMGNSSVPYPVLLTNKNVYLMLSKTYMNLTELDKLSKKEKAHVLAHIDDDPYIMYYNTPYSLIIGGVILYREEQEDPIPICLLKFQDLPVKYVEDRIAVMMAKDDKRMEKTYNHRIKKKMYLDAMIANGIPSGFT